MENREVAALDTKMGAHSRVPTNRRVAYRNISMDVVTTSTHSSTEIGGDATIMSTRTSVASKV